MQCGAALVQVLVLAQESCWNWGPFSADGLGSCLGEESKVGSKKEKNHKDAAWLEMLTAAAESSLVVVVEESETCRR